MREHVLFVLDNIFIGFNMGLTTYFQKIALSPEEIKTWLENLNPDDMGKYKM